MNYNKDSKTIEIKYLVKYKHKQGTGMGLCVTLKGARHDAKLLNGTIINKKTGKRLKRI